MAIALIVYLIPDPAAGTGIQAIRLMDNRPGAEWDGATVMTGEDQTDEVEVTTSPVETGANVADNIRTKASKCSFTFVVGNTPSDGGTALAEPAEVILDVPKTPLNLFSPGALIGAGIGALGDALFGPKPTPRSTNVYYVDHDPIAEMHNALLAVMSAKALCLVITTTRTLYDMAITSIKPTRKNDGKAAEFNVTLEQVFTVSSSTVVAPKPLEPRGATAKAAGDQAPKPPAAAAAKSVAKKILDGGAAGLNAASAAAFGGNNPGGDGGGGF